MSEDPNSKPSRKIKRSHKIGAAWLSLMLPIGFLYTNGSWDPSAPIAQGQIGVTGDNTTNETSIFLPGNINFNLAERDEDAGGGGVGEQIVVTAEKKADEYECHPARQELFSQLQAAQNSEFEIVVIAELHGRLTQAQYGMYLDVAVKNPNTACFAPELSADYVGDHMANAINAAASRGMRIVYIDPTQNQSGMDATWNNGAQPGDPLYETTLRESLNGRDQLMAQNVASALQGCSQVITLNGSAHANRKYDEFVGPRTTLTDNLQQMGFNPLVIDVALKQVACE